jgi:Aspartyl protease
MQIQSNNEMGKVFATLTITNRADQIRAEDGTILLEQIRSITLKNVLVDTGATTLCLPQDAIAKLGLKLLKEVDVATAMGIGKDALLGVIPLEALGLEIDLQNQTLKALPISPTETYLTIL